MAMEPMNIQYPEAVDDNQFKFDSPNIRSNFIRKVYLILCTQLVFTAGCVLYALSFGKVAQTFYMENQYLLVISLIVNMACSYSLFCYRSVARTVPTNYILLSLFTISLSFICCASVVFSDPDLVAIAAILTAIVVIALTLYAFTTKTDFTMCGGLLFVCSLLLFGMILLSFIFPGKGFQIVISACACLLFGVYLIYDTQLIVGNHQLKLEVDDYIIGALALYIDIIQLFMEILRLLQATRN